jgi:hypothetical protein
MNMTPPTFLAQHKWDRTFFLIMTAVSWIAIVMGFGPQVSEHFTARHRFRP